MKKTFFIFLSLGIAMLTSCTPDLNPFDIEDDYSHDDDEGGYITCTWCKGSGDCHACGGDGWWLGNAEECDYCDGCGVCEHCNGTGELEY